MNTSANTFPLTDLRPPEGVPPQKYADLLAELGDGPLPTGSTNHVQLLRLVAQWEWARITGQNNMFPAGDRVYFLQRYGKLLAANDRNTFTVQPFHPLRPFQRELLEAFDRDKLILILKARQIGASWLVAADSVWLGITQPHVEQIFLSRREEDAKYLLDRAKFVWENLPAWMRELAPNQNTDHSYRLGWSNKSIIEAHPSKKSPVRSRTPRRVVADEFAHFENQVDAWASMIPAARTGGELIVLSSANGVGDTFEAQVQRARAGQSNFKFFFFSWRADPTRDAAWFDAVTADMEPWQIAQEYPDNPDEAFLRSGSLRFDPNIIDSWEKRSGRVGIIHRYGFDTADDGYLEVYEDPEPQAVYVIGADVAEGLEHGDWSVAHVLRKGTGFHVATLRVRNEPADYAVMLDNLGRWYNKALIGVERNASGLSTLTELKRHLQYPRLYYQVVYDQRTRKQTERLGWSTSTVTKPLMIDAMWQAMRHNVVRSTRELLHREMRTYRRGPDGKTFGQPFDDEVMAMAIAVQMLQHVGHERIDKAQPTPTISSPFSHDNSFAAWRQLILNAERGQPSRLNTTAPVKGMPRRVAR